MLIFLFFLILILNQINYRVSCGLSAALTTVGTGRHQSGAGLCWPLKWSVPKYDFQQRPTQTVRVSVWTGTSELGAGAADSARNTVFYKKYRENSVFLCRIMRARPLPLLNFNVYKFFLLRTIKLLFFLQMYYTFVK